MAGFNIANFRSVINERDILRPNLAMVRFTMPIGMVGTAFYDENLNAVNRMEYYCEGAALPDYTLATWDAARYGYGAEERRPYQAKFTDITFMLIADGEDQNFRFFHQWMNMIYNTDTRVGLYGITSQVRAVADSGQNQLKPQFAYELSYKREYTTDVQIILYDAQGQVRRVCNLTEAFPSSIGQQQTMWADNNQYLRIPVSFTFTSWYQDSPESVT